MLKTEENFIDDEIRFMLNNPLSRRFLFRLLVEECGVFSTGYQYNATAYGLLAKRDIGIRMLNLCREINPEQTQKAEREFFEFEQKRITKGNNNNE